MFGMQVKFQHQLACKSCAAAANDRQLVDDAMLLQSTLDLAQVLHLLLFFGWDRAAHPKEPNGNMEIQSIKI